MKMEIKLKRLTVALAAALTAVSAGAFTAFADEGDVEINEENFPNSTFRQYIASPKFDSSRDGSLSQDEIALVTEIILYDKNIDSLKGIEYFTSLEKLNCGLNELKELDLSSNTKLKELNCTTNQLTELDLGSNTELTILDCRSNQLTSLDVSSNTFLTELNCYDNQLASLDVSRNDVLTSLICNGNKLTKLDLKNNTMLMSLNCSGNAIESLDLNGCSGLYELFCDENKLTELEVSNCKGLRILNCYKNNLVKLDVSKNENITGVECYENKLTSLDISGCSSLWGLTCSDNRITSLDISDCTSLVNLRCSNNQLKSLDVSKNTALAQLICSNNQLTSLNVSSCTKLTTLDCSYNQIGSLDVSKNTALTNLYCHWNCLESLDVSGHSFLNELNCSNNALTSLDVNGCGRLTGVSCFENQLTSLDLSSCTSLTSAACGTQKLYIGDVDGSYPLPADFDINKVRSLTGAEYDSTLNALVNFTSKTVTYNYDCGMEQSMNVTLFADSYRNDGEVYINEVNFPDENFRNYVSYYFDKDGDNIITKDELAAVSNIDVSRGHISDLKGIEYFTSLEILKCGGNEFKSLDLSRNTALKELDCSFNPLTALDVSGNTALTSLNCCGSEQLTSINARDCTALTKLICRENQLTGLDVSGCTALTELKCANNQLTSLDVSSCTALEDLNCADNLLTSLDVSSNTALDALLCQSNQLSSLDVSKNTALRNLHCFNNQFTSLDVSGCNALYYFTCYGNQLTALDVSKNTALSGLDCSDNQLTSLDVGKNTALIKLSCSDNQLTSLDLSGNTALKETDLSGNSFDIGEVTYTYDLANLPAGFDISKASNWQGAVCENGVLKKLTADSITYTYDCGNGISETFTLTVNLKPEEPVPAFVERLYTTLLGRASEAEGKAEWVADLKNGRPAADVASGFVLSEELANQNLSNGEFVDRMYRTLLGREADGAGKAEWVSILDSGCSYGYILSSFAGSQEFINLCDSYGITAGSYVSSEPRDKNLNLTAFVSRMYTKALNRAYDVDGLNGWTNDYLTGAATAEKIAYGFIFSPEFVNRELSDEQYVDTLYRTFFDREPDEGGKEGWLTELANGASRQDVLDGFLGAQEFANLKSSFGV